MKPRISVIVPVYNAEKYLPQCLDSLIHQSIEDIEIILVNDGSTDRSEQVCDQYAEKDKRIKVISKSNAGQSEARNCGLRIASGEVIGFVDSDDYIDLNMFEYLLKIKDDNKAQIAVGGMKMVSNDGHVYMTRAVEKECVCNTHDAIAEVLYSKRVLNAVTNKIFDRELFDGLLFPAGQIFEDAYLIYDLVHRAPTVVFTDQVFYYYRYNQESTTHKPFSIKEFDRVKASLKKVDFIGREYPDLISLAEQYLVYDCMMTMSKMNHYDHQYDELLIDNIKKYWRSFLKGEHTLSAKLFVISAMISPEMTVRCNRLLHK